MIARAGFWYSRIRRPLLGALTLGLVLAIGYPLYLQHSGNFHEVITGELYRSAQPSPAAINYYARRYGIRSIVNLRGEKPGAAWYDAEVEAARQLNIRHIDFHMSAKKGLTQTEGLQLIAVLKDAPKPVLIHCEGGADRTGLAAALYLAAISHAGEWPAEQQLSFLYGHFSLWFLASYAMDDTFELMEPLLGYFNS